jgi:hypothetical protein
VAIYFTQVGHVQTLHIGQNASPTYKILWQPESSEFPFHAKLTSHCLRWQCGAGTLACRVETLLDPLRARQYASRSAARSLRTPDVVEFAVSPRVGQAVLAFARSYSSSGPNSAPHLRSSRHRKKWLSPFSPPDTNCGATSGVPSLGAPDKSVCATTLAAFSDSLVGRTPSELHLVVV